MIDTELIGMHMKAFKRTAPRESQENGAQGYTPETVRPTMATYKSNQPAGPCGSEVVGGPDVKVEKACPKICVYIAQLEALKQQTKDYSDRLNRPDQEDSIAEQIDTC